MERNPFDDFKIIYQYTSDQAVEDGILICVSRYGIPLINFFTKSVLELCIQPFVKEDSDGSELITRLKQKVLTAILFKERRIKTEISGKKLTVELLDWLYEVEVWRRRFLLVQNETGGYTLMLPEDY